MRNPLRVHLPRWTDIDTSLTDRGLDPLNPCPEVHRERSPRGSASSPNHDGSLRLGAFLTTRRDGQRDGTVFDEALDLAQRAERLGYDSIWLSEHHFIDYGRCPAPLTMAPFILGQTSHIRVGTAVVLLALHNPVEVAEQTALIDQLSDGRFDLGVGKGGYTRDLAAFEVPPALHDQQWKTDLHTLTDILDSGRVTRTGPAHWSPGLPIAPAINPQLRCSRYIATSTPTTIEWAAQHGYALLLPYHVRIQEKARLVTLYERFADQHGIDPASVSHVATAIAQVADTRTEAIAAIREPGRRWLERGLTNLGHDTLRSLHAYRAKLDEEQHRHRSPGHLIDGLISAGPVGTVKDCVAWLDELASRTGVKRTALFLDVSGNHQSTTENMTRFATDVLPKLNP